MALLFGYKEMSENSKLNFLEYYYEYSNLFFDFEFPEDFFVFPKHLI